MDFKIIILSRWLKLKESLTKENEMNISTYNQLEMCIKNAASVVIQKKKIKKIKERNKVHILGYDKVIKEAIKQRRKACGIWKKEQNNIQKQQKHIWKETLIWKESKR